MLTRVSREYVVRLGMQARVGIAPGDVRNHCCDLAKGAAQGNAGKIRRVSRPSVCVRTMLRACVMNGPRPLYCGAHQAYCRHYVATSPLLIYSLLFTRAANFEFRFAQTHLWLMQVHMTMGELDEIDTHVKPRPSQLMAYSSGQLNGRTNTCSSPRYHLPGRYTCIGVGQHLQMACSFCPHLRTVPHSELRFSRS